MKVSEDDFPFVHPGQGETGVVVPFAPPSAYDEEAPPNEEDADAPLPGVWHPSQWQGKHAPFRRFIIDGWLVRGSAGLLSGQEGVGKSLLVQQLLTCAAAGKPFLSLEIERVPTVYITCEDSMDELWRRQESINRSLGITMADLEDKLLLVSLHGEIGNELGTFDSEGRLTPSLRYRQIEAQVLEFGAGMVALDNAAHLFTGNENARHDVAAFLGLLERLSIAIDGCALLLAHPNKQHAQGNKQGNEYSGSTGWSAHVRNRLFLDWPEPGDDGEPVDDDGRVLRKSKANYGKKGEEITFRWHEWAFQTNEQIGPNLAAQMADTARASYENDIFLACLDKATKERRNVSASTSARNYAPRVFARMPTAEGLKTESLERAMQRLLHLGSIRGGERVFQYPNRTWAVGIVRE